MRNTLTNVVENFKEISHLADLREDGRTIFK
jgi:hypothetical protein